MNTEWNEWLFQLSEWCNNIDQLLESRNLTLRDEQVELISTKLERIKGLLKNDSLRKEHLELITRETKMLESTLKLIHDTYLAELCDKKLNVGGHILPPLPYPYQALSPIITEEMMRIHHLVHHKAYVDGLNKAEVEIEKAREKKDYQLLKHWQRELSFHGSGHYLHTLYFNCMKPQGGGEPKGNLYQAIECNFGSFEGFKEYFQEVALKVEGVGWAILVWCPRTRRLEVLQTEKHQLFTQWDTIPLLTLDMWEHAYYLEYKADRKKFIEQWWNLVNWDTVESRFEISKGITWDSV